MSPLRIGTTPQMFLDDYIVERTFNLTPVMHQVRKYPGNPILRPESPAEGWSVNLYGTVLRSSDHGSFRMWYQGYGKGGYHALYATSEDGIFWKRPNLGIVEFEGNRDNNLISTDMALINVIEEPDDPDHDRRYKCLYFARLGTSPIQRLGESSADRAARARTQESRATRVCVAFSPDGVTWTPYEHNPVLEGTSDTHTLLGWDDRVRRYVAYTRPGIREAGRGIRVIGRSESEDFITWSDPEIVLQPDEDDPPAMEFYGMPVFAHAGMYIGLPWAYHAHEEEPSVRMDAEVDVQLAVSRDGVQWQRTGNRRPFIPRGVPGSFDSRGIYTAKAPVIVGNEFWFYYGGSASYHGDGSRKSNYALGLAKLRLNGFVSMEAIDGDGWLVTKPFTCEGSRLTLNMEGNGGYVTVAVLDAEGTHLPGYHRIESALIDGDGLNQPVSWLERSSLDGLQGQVIRLKFSLRDGARLYAFQIDA